MLHIVTALHAEAAPVISRYNLKRDLSARGREMFRADGISLVVSGMGKVRSALAVGQTLLGHAESDSDLIVNLGICGALPEIPIGEMRWVNQVTDHGSRRRFYPDAIVKHGVPEAALLTCDQPVYNRRPSEHAELFDMEGSGFFEAACSLLAPHQICCLKIVSDHLMPGIVTSEIASDLVEARMNEIDRVVSTQLAYLNSATSGVPMETILLLDELGRRHHFTTSQRRILDEQVRAYILKGGDAAILGSLQFPPAETRRQSKEIFERMRHALSAS
jgi:nucleoside phosphorylase